jgi:uncharacterized membrane protein (DUF106 family)
LDLNATIFPFLGPVGTFVNTLKVLVGGVFGVYLIMLYLRLREYLFVRKKLEEIHNDLRAIAAHSKVRLPKANENRMAKMKKEIKEALVKRG